ncbi:MAG: MFS transporter, partial [bacterium]
PEAERKRSRRRTIARVSVFLVLTSAVGAAIASFTAFMPLYLVDVFSLSEELAAGALSLFFLTGVVAAPLGGELSDRFGPVPVLITLSIAAGPLLLFATWAPSALIFLAIIVVVGVATFVRMPVSESYLSADVPERLRSTVLGVYFFAGMEASGVLTPILGYLIDTQGFAVAFTVFGAALTLVAVISAIALHAVRRW